MKGYSIIIMMKRLHSIVLIVTIAWFYPTEVISQSSTPYGGQPWPIPGIIEAEDFDLGGEGVGYHDMDSVNNGGQYRLDEGVDIGISEDGAGSQYLVDWTSSGEWLQYTVEVMNTGIYKLVGIYCKFPIVK